MKKQRPLGNSPARIILYDYSNESPSGLTETNRWASLEIDSSGDVVLLEKYQHSEFIRRQNDQAVYRKFKIAAEKLTELIEEHGEAVPEEKKKKKASVLKKRS